MILIFMLSLSASCVKKDNDEGGDLGTNDFRPPEGEGSGEFSLVGVIGLEASAESYGVELSWVIPSPLRTEDYLIHIFRSEGPSSFDIPDPTSQFSSAALYEVSEFYEPSAITAYTNTNTPTEFNIAPDTEYTYHVYIQVGDEWSDAAKANITTLPNTFAQDLNRDSSFWDSFSYTMGFLNPGGGVTSGTVTGSGTTEWANDIAYAERGAIMYLADTQENRVMIYINQGLLSCAPFTQGSADYDICVALAVNDPYIPFGVLGQRDFSESFDCQDVGSLENDSCLTSPTSIEVYNGNIIISDTGNNRIVTRPTTQYGCYNLEAQSGGSTPVNCGWTGVIGQAGLDNIDMTYDVTVEGESSLDAPMGISQFNGDLYIADSGNNRVVKACRFTNETVFSCVDPTDWQTSLCSFCAVLGQENLTTKVEFENEFGTTLTYDSVENQLSDDTFLAKYFIPVDIEVTQEHFVVHSRESFFRNMGSFNLELRDRLMFFPLNSISQTLPNCREETFNNTDNCEAQVSLGNIENAPVILNLGDDYLSRSFTLRDAHFEILGQDIIGSMENQIFFINDYVNNQTLSNFLVNPEGAYSEVQQRNLPDFGLMNRVIFNNFTGQLLIYDSDKGQNHAFSIYSLD
jgi:hypothetical protein